MDEVISKLRQYEDYGLAIGILNGYFTHKDTVACLTFLYDGNEYYYEYNFGKEYPEESAEFMWEEGNYSCDCNRSSFLAEKYDVFKEMDEFDCGEDIELVDIKIDLGRSVI